MRRFVVVAGLAAALLILPACSSPAPNDSTSANKDSQSSALGHPAGLTNDALGDAFIPLLQDSGMPGGQIYVDVEDGSSVSSSWSSDIPGSEVTAGSVLAYRSITKSFIGTVILQLTDEGTIALTDPVSDYVPGVPGGDVITIDDLARMRSGLANYSALPAMSEALNTRIDAPPATETILDWAYAASPDFPPGTRYEYSNTNTLLLGEVIERVTGAPWYDAVRTRVLEPLGLSSVSAGFLGGPHDATGFDVSADSDPDPVPVVAAGWFGAAGALTGNVEDLATWGAALGSGSLLTSSTQVARVESLTPIDEDAASPEYDRYGFALGEIAGWIGHTGNGLGFQSLVMYEPVSGRTVAILLNGTGSDPNVPAHIFRQLLPVLNSDAGATSSG